MTGAARTLGAMPVPRWLPNAISFLRVLLVPGWVACAEAANRADDAGTAGLLRWAATLVLMAIGASDALDGWLARRYRLQTRLGATVDAVADKLAQVVLATYLALRIGPAFAPIPLWFLALLIARDALLALGYTVIRRRRGSVDTEHEQHGRLASLCLFAVLLAFSSGLAPAFTRPLVFVTAAVVATSTWMYARRGVLALRARGPR